MIEQFTETKLTIMIVAMNLALIDNWIEANAIITTVLKVDFVLKLTGI